MPQPNFIFIMADDIGVCRPWLLWREVGLFAGARPNGRRGHAIHERLLQFTGLLSVAVRDHDGTVPASAEGRLRRADRERRAPPRAAAGASRHAFALARRRLLDRAYRKVGPHDLWEGDEEVHVDGYLTDILSDRAADYIRRKAKDGPYLLSVHYNAPHWPWETREDRAEAERIKSLFHLDGGSVEVYQRMIHHMDEGIGRMLQAVSETGGRDNTLVLFTSDNGAERFSDTWPLVGKKMDLLEGGIRVPYIVRWPARITPKTVSDRVVMGMDWMPTFLAAAGVAPHRDYPLDGVDVFGPDVPRKVFWRMKFRNQKAVRSGDWKWLSIDGNEFLFNLKNDQRERANLRYRELERFVELRRAYFEWDALMPLMPEDATYTLAYNDETLAKSAG